MDLRDALAQLFAGIPMTMALASAAFQLYQSIKTDLFGREGT
jgi:hypothetical protein